MSNRESEGLTPLQKRVLEALPETVPPWVLTGGAALVGFYLHHRATRDLDLFWHGREHLGEERDACIRSLRERGLEVHTLQREPAFVRLIVSDGTDTVQVDLVADPVEAVEEATAQPLGAVEILVDTPHEILVNKLCALLGRSEMRDLVDVLALTDRGEDLERALRDAPRKDTGFSAVSLAWVLRGLPLNELASAASLDAAETERMVAMRNRLVKMLVRESYPD